jgi:hypothetical protein
MEDPQMTDPPHNVNPDTGPDRESPTGVSRWVKVVGYIVAVVVLLVVVMLLVGGGLGGHQIPQH